MKKLNRFPLLFTSLFASTALLFGCSGGDDETAEDYAPSEEEVSEAAEAAESMAEDAAERTREAAENARRAVQDATE